MFRTDGADYLYQSSIPCMGVSANVKLRPTQSASVHHTQPEIAFASNLTRSINNAFPAWNWQAEKYLAMRMEGELAHCRLHRGRARQLLSPLFRIIINNNNTAAAALHLNRSHNGSSCWRRSSLFPSRQRLAQRTPLALT